jgi:hypothetical protein
MELDTIGRWGLPHFDLASLRVEGQILLGLYVLLFAVILVGRRRDFQSWDQRRWLAFVALIGITVPLNNILWVRFPSSGLLPPPGVPAVAPQPSTPLLGSLTVLLTGVVGGPGPAMVAGMVAGLARGGLDSSRVFEPAELAAFGLIAGVLLSQVYPGRIWRILRQPLAAAVSAAVACWVLLWLGVYAVTRGSSLSALDYTRSWLFAAIGAVALDGLVGGLLVQTLYRVRPQLEPTARESAIPPHQQSMSRRLLSVIIPLTLITFVALFAAVTTSAVNEATNALHDGAGAARAGGGCETFTFRRPVCARTGAGGESTHRGLWTVL